MTYSVGTTTGQTYLPGLTSTLTSIVSANLVVNGGAYLPVQERIYATGNWTRPANPVQIADWVKVTCVGGGGSGGSATSWTGPGSGGGGAGQYLTRFVNISGVAAGGTIPVVIGTGGATVGGNSNGNNGGNTSFGVSGNGFHLIAYGGGGGGYATGVETEQQGLVVLAQTIYRAQAQAAEAAATGSIHILAQAEAEEQIKLATTHFVT
jgi:hypothetical protein